MNRCLTEGRKAFLARVAGIEAGGECERLEPLLSRLVDGEATADDLATLRPHIRTCLSCRAALREYRSAPATAAALVPAAAFTVQGRPGFLDLPARAAEVLAGWTQKAQAAAEMATAQKVAAVAASTAVLGGGAAVTVQRVEQRPEPPKRVAKLDRDQPAAPPRVSTPSAPAAAVTTQPAAPQLSDAERQEREAKRKTPPAQQEFEPAWAAGEPAPSSTATAATASTSSASEPAQSTRSGGGGEEFAP